MYMTGGSVEKILGKFENLMTNPDDIDDLNRRGAYLHVLADALVSVLVILALIIGMFNSGLVILDPLIGIIAGVVIARWAVGLLVLMVQGLNPEDLTAVKWRGLCLLRSYSGSLAICSKYFKIPPLRT